MLAGKSIGKNSCRRNKTSRNSVELITNPECSMVSSLIKSGTGISASRLNYSFTSAVRSRTEYFGCSGRWEFIGLL